MTAARGLIDTNILVYSHDVAAGERHRLAADLVEQLVDAGDAVVSVQCLNEFYYSTTRKRRGPSLSHEDALAAVKDMASAAEVLPISDSTTLLALEAVPKHELSFLGRSHLGCRQGERPGDHLYGGLPGGPCCRGGEVREPVLGRRRVSRSPERLRSPAGELPHVRRYSTREGAGSPIHG
jgi:predicted nucleic acid-binding protein